MTEDTKYTMFQNRLTKVYRHLSKTARRQGMSCYRIYDHDLSEFPFSIEVYDQKIYVAEYKRKHNLSDEAHEFWMRKSVEVIAQVLQISKDKIYTKIRQRKPGRLGQYQKTDATKNEFIVLENGLKFIVNLMTILIQACFWTIG